MFLFLTAAALVTADPQPVRPAPMRPDPAALMAAERAALARFAWMDGEWRGVATTQTPTGTHKVTHTERVGTLLGGTVRLVEGHSYRDDGSTGFNALAMIRFDPASGKYRMVSHAEGQAGEFEIVPTATGYRWSIPAGPMTIVYTATVKDGVWTEIGERQMPGGQSVKFFEMTMRRVGDSAWPASGAVKPR